MTTAALATRRAVSIGRIARRIPAAIVVAAAVVIGFYGYQFLIVGTAYSAHMLCSGVFVSGRTSASVLATDLGADDLAPLAYLATEVDPRARRVRAHFFGLASRTAIYRDDLGCVVADRNASAGVIPRHSHGTDDHWPEPAPDATPSGTERALEWAFNEPDSRHQRRTRAVVVVHDGRLVAERYASGFDKDTPLLGWSMAKSVVNALAGVLVKDGRMALDAPIGGDLWPAGDPRRAITLSQMLRMSSGLDFDEDSIDPRGGVLFMLLRAPDVPAYAAIGRLDATPGTRWQYSSATTNSSWPRCGASSAMRSTRRFRGERSSIESGCGAR